jgi:hypothetical protein
VAGGGVGLKSDTGYAEARRLGHHWIGEEHALLALSRREGAAGETLRAAGATPERLEAAIVGMLERADPPVERRETDSPDLTPAMYSAFGRAEGLALARGEESTPDDLLVALLWRAGLGSSLLHLLGVDRAALARGFAEAGIAVPPGEPKPLDLRPTKRVDVPYEHLMQIVAAMPSRLPDGSPFGFNLHHETRRAWIVVGQDVDAKRLMSDFKSDTSGRAGVSGEEEVSD